MIANGSFEQGAPYPATSTAPAGWFTIGGDTYYGPGSTWGLTPTDGTQLAIIGRNASFNGGIKTTEFSLTQGQQYTFSFDATGEAAYMADWTPVAWEPGKMGLYYYIRYTDGALVDTAAAEGAVYPVAIDSWTTTSVTFTAAQSGYAEVEVYTYGSGWANNVAHVYSAVDNVELNAVVPKGWYMAPKGWPNGPYQDVNLWDTSTFPELVASGATFVRAYAKADPANAATINAYLASASSYGLSVFLDISAYVAQEDWAGLSTAIQTFNSNPAVKGWYTCDEPSWASIGDSKTSVARLKAGYQTIKAAAPTHQKPVFLVLNMGEYSTSEFRGAPMHLEYMDCADVFGYDDYPWMKNRGTEFSYNGLNDGTYSVYSVMAEFVRRGKQFWFVPQAFGANGEFPNFWRLPTAGEHRWQHFMALMHGASASFAWDYKVLSEHPLASNTTEPPHDTMPFDKWATDNNYSPAAPVWQVWRDKVYRDTALNIPSLLKAGPPFSVAANYASSNNPNLKVTTYQDTPLAGRRFILADNTTGANQTATFTINASVAKVMRTGTAGEAGNCSFIACTGNTFTDTIPAGGYHCYLVGEGQTFAGPATPFTGNDDFATTKAGSSVAIPVLANDSDPNILSSGSASISLGHGLGGPYNGIATVNATTGVVTYTPNPGFSGRDFVAYAVRWSNGVNLSTGRVMIDVTNPDTVPGLAEAETLHLTFDEGGGTTSYDSAFGGATTDVATILGSFTWVDGRKGKAVHNSGNYDCVTIPDSADQRPGSNFSATCWFKLDKTIAQQTYAWPLLINKSNWPRTQGYLLFLDQATDAVGFQLVGGGSVTWSNSGLAANAWHQATATYDGATIKLYVNGVLRGQTPCAGWNNHSTAAMTLNNGAEGAIDEARVCNMALSSLDVRRLANERLHFPLNEQAGSAQSFGIGMAEETTPTEPPTLFNNATMGVTGIRGFSMQSGNENWSGSKIGTDGNYNPASPDITISAWVNLSSYANFQTIVDKQDWANQKGYAMWFSNYPGYEGIAFRILGASSYSQVLIPTSQLALNTWMHIVGTYSYNADTQTGSLNLYKNGVLVDSASTSIRREISPGIPFAINGNGNATTSLVDEVRLFDGALNSTEVGGLYHLDKPNQAPTALALGNVFVTDGSPASTTVGTFSTTDPDVGDTFTYSLVSGSGSGDNASFTIHGAQLKTNFTANANTQNSYAIRVRSTDQGGRLYVENTFTVVVNRVITNGSFEQGAPYAITYTEPTGWVTTGGDTAYGPGSSWGLTPPDGTQLALIGGTASWTGGIATTWFSLTQGQQYTFSFDAAGQAAYNINEGVWTPVAWEPGKMGLYYYISYKDGALANTAAAEGSTFPVAINSWTTTSVTFTAAQSGYAGVNVYTYKNGWTPNGYVYSAVDNFKLEAVLPTYGAWATTNVGGQAANLDWDNDGVPNGIEYFMNAAPGFTSNPTMNATKTVTWPNGGNIPSSEYGTGFVVQTSANLVNWTNVPGTDPNLVNTSGSVSYAVTGTDKQFVRLKVTLN